jgi:hypothetical protein
MAETLNPRDPSRYKLWRLRVVQKYRRDKDPGTFSYELTDKQTEKDVIEWAESDYDSELEIVGASPLNLSPDIIQFLLDAEVKEWEHLRKIGRGR